MKETVLVLGAGVSATMGYPTGSQLIGIIREALSSQRSNRADAEEMLRDLAALKPQSIDSFLNEKREFRTLVRPIIKRAIFKAENIHRTVNGIADESQSFYALLFNSLSEDDFSKLKIITYNYDRSFEFFFLNALLRRHRGQKEKAVTIFKRIKIIHIHGRLPLLPNEEPAFSYPVDYAVETDGSRFQFADDKKIELESAHRILMNDEFSELKTVYENGELNEIAKSYIESSKRVFFIGFAYNDLNMKILGYRFDQHKLDMAQNRKTVGTCYGVKPVELKRLRRLYPEIHFVDSTGYDLFQSFVSLTNQEDDVI